MQGISLCFNDDEGPALASSLPAAPRPNWMVQVVAFGLCIATLVLVSQPEKDLDARQQMYSADEHSFHSAVPSELQHSHVDFARTLPSLSVHTFDSPTAEPRLASFHDVREGMAVASQQIQNSDAFRQFAQEQSRQQHAEPLLPTLHVDLAPASSQSAPSDDVAIATELEEQEVVQLPAGNQNVVEMVVPVSPMELEENLSGIPHEAHLDCDDAPLPSPSSLAIEAVEDRVSWEPATIPEQMPLAMILLTLAALTILIAATMRRWGHDAAPPGASRLAPGARGRAVGRASEGPREEIRHAGEDEAQKLRRRWALNTLQGSASLAALRQPLAEMGSLCAGVEVERVEHSAASLLNWGGLRGGNDPSIEAAEKKSRRQSLPATFCKESISSSPGKTPGTSRKTRRTRASTPESKGTYKCPKMYLSPLSTSDALKPFKFKSRRLSETAEMNIARQVAAEADTKENVEMCGLP